VGPQAQKSVKGDNERGKKKLGIALTKNRTPETGFQRAKTRKKKAGNSAVKQEHEGKGKPPPGVRMKG